MRHYREKSPTELLAKSGPTLSKLYQKAHDLLRIQACVKTHLGAPLSEHCWVANWREGCLVIQVESGAWATHIRYAIPDLLIKLRQIPQLRGLRTIHHSVQPRLAQRLPSQTGPRIQLSPENGLLIDSLADAVTHPALSATLKRLAKRALIKP